MMGGALAEMVVGSESEFSVLCTGPAQPMFLPAAESSPLYEVGLDNKDDHHGQAHGPSHPNRQITLITLSNSFFEETTQDDRK